VAGQKDCGDDWVVDLLDWGITVLNIAVDEGCDVVGGGIDVLLSLGDPQLCHQFVKNLLAVFVLLGRHAGG